MIEVCLLCIDLLSHIRDRIKPALIWLLHLRYERECALQYYVNSCHYLSVASLRVEACNAIFDMFDGQTCHLTGCRRTVIDHLAC